MSDVNMPKLSDTMEEGTVLEWKKQDGDQVSKGDVLAEIESDKASFEIEAESDGVLHIVVDKGQPVPVGQQIAVIGGEAAPSPPPAESPVGARRASPSPQPAAPRPSPPPPPRAPAGNGNGVKVSPLARRLAREMGV